MERFVLDLLPDLTDNEKNYIQRISKSIDLKGKDIDVVGPSIAHLLVEKILSVRPIDIKAMQISMLGNEAETSTETSNTFETETKVSNELNLDSILSIDNLVDFKLMFNPESLYTHYYLACDSDYRNTADETDTIQKFNWQYTPTQNFRVGFCNSIGVIRNIIGMRLYQPRIPYLAAMNTNAKRVSVLIEEFAAQAFIAENGRRFHFLLRPQFVTGQSSIELSTEDYNDGIFNFRKPITSLSSITLSFGDPLNILTFTKPFTRFMIAIEFVCLNLDN